MEQGAKDTLHRAQFVDAVLHHIEGLAAVPVDHLFSPRVLAVDGPWGAGKSWVAQKLTERLTEKGPFAFIDAFRYDHHSDAFAVIAAAVIKALKPKRPQQLKLMAAAGAILTGAAPLATKSTLNLGLKLLGLDSEDISAAVAKAEEGIIEGAAKLSEKSVEKIFKAYSDLEAQQTKFMESLGEVTAQLTSPFVVVVDELDRCRPSFALEVLERIKHVFSALNVVFVLFWSSSSIHESIRHTYGRGTNAELYLGKFVALSIPLPLTRDPRRKPTRRYSTFIEGELSRVIPASLLANLDRALLEDFLGELSEAFDASLRDVQRAIGNIRIMLPTRGNEGYSILELVYVSALRAFDEPQFQRLMFRDRDAIRQQANRLEAAYASDTDSSSAHVWLTLRYLIEQERFDALRSNPQKIEALESPEDVIFEIGVRQGAGHWMQAAVDRLHTRMTSTPRK